MLCLIASYDVKRDDGKDDSEISSDAGKEVYTQFAAKDN